MAPYQYQPLDSKSSQIRLLHLLPKTAGSSTATGRSDEVWISAPEDCSAYETFNKSIERFKANKGPFAAESETPRTSHGRLETVSLESEPRYTALSYVWGDPSDRVSFVLDGHHVLITRNLALALQALQLDDEPLVLWIDAICINQNDPEEKSGQVLRMKDIYASASLVIVWLGSAATVTDVAMDMLNAYYEIQPHGTGLDLTARHTYRIRDEQRQELLEQSPEFKRLIESDSILTLFKVMRFLMTREWWYRVWVVQEFCFGREVWFACGSKKLKVAVFDHAIMVLNLFLNVSVAHDVYTAEQRISTSKRDLPKRLDKKDDAMEVEHAINFLKQRLYHQDSLEEKKNRSLLDLLITFYINVQPRTRLRSTDPKDKLYGLLSIASDMEQLNIIPDYSKKGVEEIYTEAAAKILSLGRLDLLQYVHPKNPNMPSWVPDWRQEERHITPYECRELDKPFCADATVAPTMPHQSPGNLNVLECTGCIVDLVSSFSDFSTDETTKALLALAEMPSNGDTPGEFNLLIRLHVHLTQIKELCQRSAILNPSLYGPSETWLNEALWRIPVADQEIADAHFHRYQRATSESERRYKGLVNTIEAFKSIGVKHGDSDPRHLRAFLQDHVLPIVQRESSYYLLYRLAISRTALRRPYMTHKGYVGLGHESMQIGDLVCIFHGAAVPFLLRRTDQGTYVLISDTYIHGIMDGEFMETRPETMVFQIV